jgi:polyhydroxyalkanoate synthesis regulator protein
MRDNRGKAGAPVLVKRYGGRRLDDPAQARYVTAAELVAMARRGRPVVVRDARTGEDITGRILDRLH